MSTTESIDVSLPICGAHVVVEILEGMPVRKLICQRRFGPCPHVNVRGEVERDRGGPPCEVKMADAVKALEGKRCHFYQSAVPDNCEGDATATGAATGWHNIDGGWVPVCEKHQGSGSDHGGAERVRLFVVAEAYDPDSDPF